VFFCVGMAWGTLVWEVNERDSRSSGLRSTPNEIGVGENKKGKTFQSSGSSFHLKPLPEKRSG